LQFERSLYGLNRRGVGIIQILPLLKRDLYGFRRHFLAYLTLWILTPILIHLLLAIPLSRLISFEVQYLNWAAAGIWGTSASMASFLETSMRIRKINYETDQIDAILQSPISNLEFLMALSLRGFIFGFIQFIFSILITCTLNHEYLGIFNILMIIIQVMSLILFFSVLGAMIGLLISNRIIFIQISLALFIIISLGMGAFIPISSYPESYIAIVNKIPLMVILQNMQSIIIHQNIQWISFFLTLIITTLLFIITLITSNKVFRNI